MTIVVMFNLSSVVVIIESFKMGNVQLKIAAK